MIESRFLRIVYAVVITIGMTSIAEAAPVLTNGSLTGSTGVDTTAPGWTISNATPDLVDATGPTNNTGVNWTLSPDGGTFQRGNGHHTDPESFSESFEQTVSGFINGSSYTLEFYQTNLGFYNARFEDWFNRDGHWGLYVDDVLVGQSTTIGGPTNFDDPIVWLADSITFTATGSIQTLRLEAFTDDASGIAYMGIDGLQLADASAVPIPAAAWLFGSGLLGLIGISRHKKTA
jgi:hypothetical protein